VFAVAAATTGALFLATLAAFGVSAWADFLQATVPSMTVQLMHDFGIPPQHAMPTVWVTLQGWGASTQVAQHAQTLSMLFALGLVAYAWRRPTADPQWRNALTGVLPLLASPFGYVYDITPVMLAVVLLDRPAPSSDFVWHERPILALMWIWPAITTLWSFEFGLPPIGAFLLLGTALCLVWRILREPSVACRTPWRARSATPASSGALPQSPAG
jgi:hypothetical protein